MPSHLGSVSSVYWALVGGMSPNPSPPGFKSRSSLGEQALGMGLLRGQEGYGGGESGEGALVLEPLKWG